MGSVRSWAGSLLSLVSFFFVRRYAAGFALPVFVSVVLSCVYLWMFVLRIPELYNVGLLQDSEKISEGQKVDARVKPGPGGLPKKNSGPVAASTSTTNRKPPTTVTNKPKPKVATAPQPVAPPISKSPDVPTLSPTVAPTSFSPPSQDVRSGGDRRAAEGASIAGKEKLSQPGVSELPTLANLDGFEPSLATASASVPANKDFEAAAPGRDEDDACSSEDGERSRPEEAEEQENVFADADRASTLKQEGNDFFKSGKVYDALEAYSEAIHVTPTSDKTNRAVLHSNRAACNQKLSRWEEVCEDCKQAIDLDSGYVKAYHRRSAAYERMEKWHDALQDLNKVVELDPDMKSKEFKHVAFLEKRAQDQFDKDKEEMVGKLKDLGNMVLGKFGMSVDNFAMEKDPNSGSYSIQYKN